MLLTLDDVRFVTKVIDNPSELTEEDKERARGIDYLSMITRREHYFSKEVLDAISEKYTKHHKADQSTMPTHRAFFIQFSPVSGGTGIISARRAKTRGTAIPIRMAVASHDESPLPEFTAF